MLANLKSQFEKLDVFNTKLLLEKKQKQLSFNKKDVIKVILPILLANSSFSYAGKSHDNFSPPPEIKAVNEKIKKENNIQLNSQNVKKEKTPQTVDYFLNKTKQNARDLTSDGVIEDILKNKSPYSVYQLPDDDRLVIIMNNESNRIDPNKETLKKINQNIGDYANGIIKGANNNSLAFFYKNEKFELDHRVAFININESELYEEKHMDFFDIRKTKMLKSKKRAEEFLVAHEIGHVINKTDTYLETNYTLNPHKKSLKETSDLLEALSDMPFTFNTEKLKHIMSLKDNSLEIFNEASSDVFAILYLTKKWDLSNSEALDLIDDVIKIRENEFSVDYRFHHTSMYLLYPLKEAMEKDDSLINKLKEQSNKEIMDNSDLFSITLHKEFSNRLNEDMKNSKETYKLTKIDIFNDLKLYLQKGDSYFKKNNNFMKNYNPNKNNTLLKEYMDDIKSLSIYHGDMKNIENLNNGIDKIYLKFEENYYEYLNESIKKVNLMKNFKSENPDQAMKYIENDKFKIGLFQAKESINGLINKDSIFEENSIKKYSYKNKLK